MPLFEPYFSRFLKALCSPFLSNSHFPVFQYIAQIFPPSLCPPKGSRFYLCSLLNRPALGLAFSSSQKGRFGDMAECGYLRSMKQSVIREIRSEEIPLLNDFLYEAIFIPEGVPAPPRSIIENEDLQVYVRDFGMKADDRCLVAEVEGKVVGAVWTRVMNDYGHIADGIPSLAISLYKDYRGQGIGTDLLREMLQLLRRDGYPQVSLSVQKANYAFRMYQKAGFEVLKETVEEYLMVCTIKNQ